MAQGKLYLVDGSTFIFRAFFAIRSLTNSEGLPTNAVYGFTAMLLKLLEAEQPDHLAVVFDKSGVTFRNEIYPDYKANRPPAPEELVPQFPLVREVTRAFRIPTLELDGYEADDIIATLATRAAEQGLETVIVSSDKDLMQLVGPTCTMLDTMKDVRYGPAEVVDKMGVRPDQIVDLLALMGDSVDNIPGVRGIGAKTAAALLAEHESLDGVYAALGASAIRGRRGEILAEHRDMAYLSQRLATVHREAPIGVGLADLARREPDRPALAALFRRLEFKSWLRRFTDGDADPEREALTRDGFALVRTPSELRALTDALATSGGFAFDTETTSLRPVEAGLVGLSFAIDPRRAWYVPVAHLSLDARPQVGVAAALDALGPLLSDPALPKAAQNGKYDVQVLRCHGVEVRGITFDTMLASYLADADKYQHSLDNIALDRLGHRTIRFEDVAGKGKHQVTFDQVPVETARDYACEDAQLVMALQPGLRRDLERLGLSGLLTDLELPLALVLADMELTGVRVDTQLLRRLSDDLGRRARQIEARAHTLAGRPFAVGSPKQLAQILFDELGLTPVKRTKTGYSTDSGVLEELAAAHELPGAVLEWRQLSKLKSTYTDVLPTLVSPRSGRIHTSYNQAVAATGRLSSTEPNLQNIPIRTEEGRRIREAFVADPGHVLLAADYSQIELRVLAHLAGDEGMREAFHQGVDIHQRTASEVFGVPLEEVTREQRGMAKTINFGVLYGMSAFRLARQQGVPRAAAQEFIDRYFARFPRVLAWKDATLAEARAKGRVQTILGRVRRVGGIDSKNAQARHAAERVAVNTPVQGSAADIIKLAMVRIHRRLAAELPQVRMVLQVHDELVFEVPEEAVDATRALVVEEMEGAFRLEIPLVVNVATGANWLEAH